ncbi:MAG: hypothetical protein ACAF41_23860 [Leptolyngbya sp. BL-A-14]
MATDPHNRAFKRSQIVTAIQSQRKLKLEGHAKPYGLVPRASSWSAIVVILLAVGGLGWAGWLGLQLIVNPQTLLWVNRFLPDWIPIPVTGLKPPQTMDAIRSELTQVGRTPGEMVPLGKNISALDHKSAVADMLLPVLAPRPNCQSDCEQIVELRVYQTLPGKQREQRFQLLDQLSIVGPDESFVLAPLINAGDANQGSTRSLPLTTLNRFEGKVPPQGVWMDLSGRWLRGDTAIAYGQVLYYNPSRVHLHQMVEWSSPVGQDPVWHDVTGDGSPELVIDQTVGMEPQFQIYQVKPRNFLPSPLQLEPLSLLEPAIDDGTYSNGLMLARSGLWSTGLQWLQSVKQREPGKWLATAEAQRELVSLHAQATQAQANKAWASPGQQVLANLIDGRWQRALTVFAANTESTLETAALLKADTGRLQSRVNAALRVSPQQGDVRSWNALLMAVRQGQNAAIVWLKKQPNMTSTDRTRTIALIKRLEAPSDENEASATLPPGQLVGAATVLASINASTWLKPKQQPPLKLDAAQRWYRVQVAGFQDGKRWHFAHVPLGLPANTTADRLWKLLGLSSDAPLSIVFSAVDGQQHVVSASIKAVRLNGDKLELLAAGEAPPLSTTTAGMSLQPLAFTEAALQWQNPETTSLADLVQQQPNWATNVLPIVSRELKRIGQLPSSAENTWESLEPLIGTSVVQFATLTGKPQPDIVLTIDLEAASQATKQAAKRKTRSRTLIFSATGTLLYSECSTDAALRYLAIADLGSSGGSAIVADGGSNYSFLRWSAKRNRFE